MASRNPCELHYENGRLVGRTPLSPARMEYEAVRLQVIEAVERAKAEGRPWRRLDGSVDVAALGLPSFARPR